MNSHQKRALMVLAVQGLGLIGCCASAWAGWRTQTGERLPLLHVSLAVPSLWLTMIPTFWFALFLRSVGARSAARSAGRRALGLLVLLLAVAVSGQMVISVGSSRALHASLSVLLVVASLVFVVVQGREVRSWFSA